MYAEIDEFFFDASFIAPMRAFKYKRKKYIEENI